MPRVTSNQSESGLCRVQVKLSPPGTSFHWRLRTGGMWRGVMYTTATSTVTTDERGQGSFEAPPGSVVISFAGGKRVEVLVPEERSEVTLEELMGDRK